MLSLIPWILTEHHLSVAGTNLVQRQYNDLRLAEGSNPCGFFAEPQIWLLLISSRYMPLKCGFLYPSLPLEIDVKVPRHESDGNDCYSDGCTNGKI